MRSRDKKVDHKSSVQGLLLCNTVQGDVPSLQGICFSRVCYLDVYILIQPFLPKNHHQHSYDFL
jgi:hypothetical protein